MESVYNGCASRASSQATIRSRPKGGPQFPLSLAQEKADPQKKSAARGRTLWHVFETGQTGLCDLAANSPAPPPLVAGAQTRPTLGRAGRAANIPAARPISAAHRLGGATASLRHTVLPPGDAGPPYVSEGPDAYRSPLFTLLPSHKARCATRLPTHAHSTTNRSPTHRSRGPSRVSILWNPDLPAYNILRTADRSGRIARGCIEQIRDHKTVEIPVVFVYD